MSEQPSKSVQRNGSAAKRLDRRDPRLPVAEMFDAEIAASLWTSLPEDCRRDHFDKTTMPAGYRAAVSETSAGGPWTTIALNLRGLPGAMTWELAWLLHREIELGRRVHPIGFNAATRVLRVATSQGGATARGAQSLLQLTPQEWLRQAQGARLRGADLGHSNDDHALSTIRRLQDVLVYPYHRGDWWRLDVWNPQLDHRIPQREHEPHGRSIANFSHLTSDWLREAAKWWLSTCLETERHTWSTLKTRLDGLKWLQRYLDDAGDDGPALVVEADALRDFMRGFLAALRSHRVTSGHRAGKPLAANPHRQILTTIEQFYAWMYDNRAEAATTLDEPRWLSLGIAHSVLFRPGDKPRLTNKRSEDMVLEDDVVARIAEGAELLALPKDEGGLGDLAAFHALMLLIRTGRRVNEVLMMDFDPLLPLVGAKDADDSGLVARMRYQQTKVQSGQSNSIPVDAEVVAIIRAQQGVAKQHMAAMGQPDREPAYLFLRQVQNRNGQHPYSHATLHAILGRLTERLGITDSQGKLVRISKTHRFRHTAATNLLNAGVPLHVVMRYFGHLTPEMTMHYAVTLSQTAEREFLRFKKVTTDGRPLPMDQGDLYDVLQLDKRADRVLPNGWCMLPPKQVCNRGNACLSCDKFVTDASHGPELRRQLADTERLVGQRKRTFLAKYGAEMDKANVWLQGREAEARSLRRILLSIEDITNTTQAVRGAGVNDRGQHQCGSTEGGAAG
ncbi:MAG: site-specific integrase [Actinomycetota bacterium]|nr:site-specific integrase [Actinomycetota bacterium]